MKTKQHYLIFFLCIALFTAAAVAHTIRFATYVHGRESLTATEDMIFGGPPAAQVEISIIRELVGYVVEMGVTGILVVIVYFLWKDRKERLTIIEAMLRTLEKSSEEAIKGQKSLETVLRETKEEIRKSLELSRQSIDKDHKLIFMLLTKMNVPESEILAVGKQHTEN